MPTKEKALLITADDFGVHDVIDNGVYACVEASSIDCVDCIVTFPDSESRIQNLISSYREKIKQKTLHIGLHVSFTCCGFSVFEPENPLNQDYTKYNHLIHSDPFTKQFDSIGDINIAELSSAKIIPFYVKEMEAQFDKFVSATGFKPHHLSCHVGFCHLTEAMFNAYMAFAEKHDIEVRCPTLISMELKAWKKLTLFKRRALKRAIQLLDNLSAKDYLEIYYWMRQKKRDERDGRKKTKIRKRFNTLIRNKQIRSTHYFIDHFFGNATFDNLDWILKNIDKTSYELVIHPAHYTDPKEYENLPRGITKSDAPAKKREALILNSFNIRQQCAERKIKTHLLR